jgi:heat shock protein HslJ
MKFQYALTLILVAVTLVACAAVSAPAPPGLAGQWRVEDLDGRGVLDRVSLTVAFADGGVSASAGCNRLSGTFEQSGARIRIGPLVSTRMACSPALMDQEQRLATSLQAVNTVSGAEGGAVRLSGPGGASLLLRPADPVQAGAGMMNLRCGDEDFQVRFTATEAQVSGPGGVTETLQRLNAQGADPEAPRVFTNSRMTFTQEIEGGRKITFARGRMAPVACEVRGG